MNATIIFKDRMRAKQFLREFVFATKKGFVMGSGTTNVEVKLHNLTKEDSDWVVNKIDAILKKEKELDRIFREMDELGI